MSRSTATFAVLGLAGLCTVAIGGVWLSRSASPDAVLASNFGSTLGAANLSWSSPHPNLWLSSLDSPGPTLRKTMAVGDTITISGKDGRPETIEVTALEQVDGGRFGQPGLRFQLLTGHVVGHQPSASTSTQVRFLFATEHPDSAPPLRSTDRVL